MSPVVALVEIGDDPALLFVIGVFIVTFIVVCALAYLLLAKRRSDGPRSTWHFQYRLPVSKGTFGVISDAAAVAISKPDLSPATQARVNDLVQMRGAFVSIHRTIMIAGGLAGLTAAVLLLRSHTPANMNGLPGAIVLLLSLGALLNGVMPGPSIVPTVEPLEPALLGQMREKIKVQVITPEPLRAALNESDMRQAAEILREGRSIADAARAVYPGYERLSEPDKRWFESTLSHLLNEAKTARS